MCAMALKQINRSWAMPCSCRFQFVYPLSSLFILFLTVPSSASSYFSYGDTLLDNANVFGVLPASPARSFAVSLESSGLLSISQCCSSVHGCAASYTSGIRCCCLLLDDAVPCLCAPHLNL